MKTASLLWYVYNREFYRWIRLPGLGCGYSQHDFLVLCLQSRICRVLMFRHEGMVRNNCSCENIEEGNCGYARNHGQSKEQAQRKHWGWLQMTDRVPCSESDEAVKIPILKRIFDAYASETITDEQLQQIVDPVVKMIREGRFNNPSLHPARTWLSSYLTG